MKIQTTILLKMIQILKPKQIQVSHHVLKSSIQYFFLEALLRLLFQTVQWLALASCPGHLCYRLQVVGN